MKVMQGQKYTAHLKFVSLFLIITLLLNSVAWADPPNAHFSKLPPHVSVSHVSEPIQLRDLNVLVDYLTADLKNEVKIDISKETGIIRSILRHDSHSSPFDFDVVLIQDAHVDNEAQTNIRQILHSLSKQIDQPLLIALEGTSGNLEPNILNFFPDYPKINSIIVEDLEKRGELTGAERFAFENQRNKTLLEFWGAENIDQYKQNLSEFRDALRFFINHTSELEQAESRLAGFRKQILNPELWFFLEKRDAFLKEEVDLAAYLTFLQSEAIQHIKLNLADIKHQFDFPNLVRFSKLKYEENKLNPEKALEECSKLLSLVQKEIPKGKIQSYLTEHLWHLSRDVSLQLPQSSHQNFFTSDRPVITEKSPNVRELFEILHASSFIYKFSLVPFRNLIRLGRFLAFQSEIDAASFFQEVRKLESLIIRRLAKTREEKRLLAAVTRWNLVKKLYALELSRSEFLDYQKSKPRILKTILRFFPALPAPALSEKFYDGALKRDHVLVQNALNHAAGRPVIMVAGGFHADGIESYLQDNNLSYATISPSIKNPSKDRESYFKTFQDENISFIVDMLRTSNPGFFRSVRGERQFNLFALAIRNQEANLVRIYSLTPEQARSEIRQALDRWRFQSRSELRQDRSTIVTPDKIESNFSNSSASRARETIIPQRIHPGTIEKMQIPWSYKLSPKYFWNYHKALSLSGLVVFGLLLFTAVTGRILEPFTVFYSTVFAGLLMAQAARFIKNLLIPPAHYVMRDDGVALLDTHNIEILNQIVYQSEIPSAIYIAVEDQFEGKDEKRPNYEAVKAYVEFRQGSSQGFRKVKIIPLSRLGRLYYTNLYNQNQTGVKNIISRSFLFVWKWKLWIWMPLLLPVWLAANFLTFGYLNHDSLIHFYGVKPLQGWVSLTDVSEWLLHLKWSFLHRIEILLFLANDWFNNTNSLSPWFQTIVSNILTNLSAKLFSLSETPGLFSLYAAKEKATDYIAWTTVMESLTFISFLGLVTLAMLWLHWQRSREKITYTLTGKSLPAKGKIKGIFNIGLISILFLAVPVLIAPLTNGFILSPVAQKAIQNDFSEDRSSLGFMFKYAVERQENIRKDDEGLRRVFVKLLEKFGKDEDFTKNGAFDKYFGRLGLQEFEFLINQYPEARTGLLQLLIKDLNLDQILLTPGMAAQRFPGSIQVKDKIDKIKNVKLPADLKKLKLVFENMIQEWESGGSELFNDLLKIQVFAFEDQYSPLYIVPLGEEDQLEKFLKNLGEFEKPQQGTEALVPALIKLAKKMSYLPKISLQVPKAKDFNRSELRKPTSRSQILSRMPDHNNKHIHHALSARFSFQASVLFLGILPAAFSGISPPAGRPNFGLQSLQHEDFQAVIRWLREKTDSRLKKQAIEYYTGFFQAEPSTVPQTIILTSDLLTPEVVDGINQVSLNPNAKIIVYDVGDLTARSLLPQLIRASVRKISKNGAGFDINQFLKEEVRSDRLPHTAVWTTETHFADIEKNKGFQFVAKNQLMRDDKLRGAALLLQFLLVQLVAKLGIFPQNRDELWKRTSDNRIEFNLTNRILQIQMIHSEIKTLLSFA